MNTREIIEEYKLKEKLYKDFSKKIENILGELIEAQRIEIHSTSSRAKLINSLEKKISIKATSECNRYKNLSEITDLAGIRIITYYEKETCDIEKLIRAEFDVDLNNSMDKGAMLDPDRFGYLSKHFVVRLNKKRLDLLELSRFQELFAEIQVRTILQHAWAENEHNLGYKNASVVPKQIKRRFARIAGLLEIADDEFSRIRKELSEYKKDIEIKIAQQDKEFLLDRISLSIIIQKDLSIRALDRSVIPSSCDLQDPSISEIDNRVDELRFNGILSIGDLERAIVDHKEDVIRFAKRWITEQTDSEIYPYGISLFYLCYVLLAKKKNKELISEYLRRCSVGLDYEWAEIANRIEKVYGEIESFHPVVSSK
jgi:putative GTP pyrophosphokinase